MSVRKHITFYKIQYFLLLDPLSYHKQLLTSLNPSITPQNSVLSKKPNLSHAIRNLM